MSPKHKAKIVRHALRKEITLMAKQRRTKTTLYYFLIKYTILVNDGQLARIYDHIRKPEEQ